MAGEAIDHPDLMDERIPGVSGFMRYGAVLA
jgi:hypothetical protein